MEDLLAAIAADEASDYTLAYTLYCSAKEELQIKADRFQADFSKEIEGVAQRIAQIRHQMTLRNVAKPKRGAKV